MRKMKISVTTHTSVFRFYGYIENIEKNIGGYFFTNISGAKII